jgi:hypothetical protein
VSRSAIACGLNDTGQRTKKEKPSVKEGGWRTSGPVRHRRRCGRLGLRSLVCRWRGWRERDPTEVSRIQPKARRSLGKARTRGRGLRLTLALGREPSVRLVLVDYLRQLSPTHPPHAQVHSCAHEKREQAEVIDNSIGQYVPSEVYCGVSHALRTKATKSETAGVRSILGAPFLKSKRKGKRW